MYLVTYIISSVVQVVSETEFISAWYDHVLAQQYVGSLPSAFSTDPRGDTSLASSFTVLAVIFLFFFPMSTPALEILEEGYLIQWVGQDPSTGQPFKPSWVCKGDCAEELVDAWEAKRKYQGGPVVRSGVDQPCGCAETYTWTAQQHSGMFSLFLPTCSLPERAHCS